MGKITVEIKKSTFGKPLHNFDHPNIDSSNSIIVMTRKFVMI